MHYFQKRIIILFGLFTVMTTKIMANSNFFYYNKEIRVSILQSIHNKLKMNYSLWEIKQSTIRGFDSDKVFLQSISDEKKINDPNINFEKAKMNLSFLDRLRHLLAKFEDSHLKLKTQVNSPYVFNGLTIKEVKGKYYVVSINNKIFEYTKKTHKANTIKINLGDEVLKIDGQKVSNLVSEYENYIPASSKLARTNKATDALTKRDFKYPLKNFAIYTLKNPKSQKKYTTNITYYHDSHNRSDLKYYFTKISMTSLEDLQLTWNEKQKKWNHVALNQISGYEQYQVPLDMIGYDTYLKSGTNVPALRTGFIIQNNRAYGVLQIFTFGANQLSFNKQKNIGFFKPIINFIAYLKKSKTPLIIDLRYNGGGNGAFPRELLSHITEMGKQYNPTTWMFKRTPTIQQMFEFLETPKKAQTKTNDIINKTTLDALKIARNNQQKFLGPFTKLKSIKASKAIRGYNEKVLILTSERCASACDIFASLIKKSKRGKIIGLPTSGTGAGAKTIGPFDTIDLSDDFKVAKVSIPNSLFGFPEKIHPKKVNSGNISTIKQLCMENSPIKPDIQYKMSLNDFLKKDMDIFQKAIKTIASQ